MFIKKCIIILIYSIIKTFYTETIESNMVELTLLILTKKKKMNKKVEANTFNIMN